MQFLAAYVLVVPAMASLAFAWQAWRLHRARQFPLPGAWVMLRTRVSTGWWFTLNKLAMVLTAIAFALLSVSIWRGLGGSWLFLVGCD